MIKACKASVNLMPTHNGKLHKHTISLYVAMLYPYANCAATLVDRPYKNTHRRLVFILREELILLLY